MMLQYVKQYAMIVAEFEKRFEFFNGENVMVLKFNLKLLQRDKMHSIAARFKHNLERTGGLP